MARSMPDISVMGSAGEGGRDSPVSDRRRHDRKHGAASAHQRRPAVDDLHADAHSGRVREEGEQEGDEEAHADRDATGSRSLPANDLVHAW